MPGFPWFAVDSDLLAGHPKRMHLARLLPDEPRVWPHVIALWSYAIRFSPTGEIPDTQGTVAAIEAVADWKGQPGALVAALVQSGWLRKDGRRRRLIVEEWADRHIAHVEKAVRDRERSRRRRANARQSQPLPFPDVKQTAQEPPIITAKGSQAVSRPSPLLSSPVISSSLGYEENDLDPGGQPDHALGPPSRLRDDQSLTPARRSSATWQSGFPFWDDPEWEGAIAMALAPEARRTFFEEVQREAASVRQLPLGKRRLAEEEARRRLSGKFGSAARRVPL